ASIQRWHSQFLLFTKNIPFIEHRNLKPFTSHFLSQFSLNLALVFYVMRGALRQVSPPTSPLGHLQHARQVLVNELPPEHDLRKRVQVDGKGELLRDQPAGRPRL